MLISNQHSPLFIECYSIRESSDTNNNQQHPITAPIDAHQVTTRRQSTDETTTTRSDNFVTSSRSGSTDTIISTENQQSQSQTTTTTSPETTSEQNDSSTGNDDDDASDCESLSSDESANGTRLSNNERFIKLQACLQENIQGRLKESRRGSMEMFESMSLSGSCTASLMNLMGGLGQLKSYAFKFMDASAKIPSGLMYGLLSDFGDFDQCLSIRSNANVDFEHEAEEGGFSGKYCLVSVRLDYHVDLEPNSTHLEGIIPDGLLWDDLIRQYWITDTPKPFQMGICVPSRCNSDDLKQLTSVVGRRYNSITHVQSCQDTKDLKLQHSADWLQRAILLCLGFIWLLSFAGSVLDRYRPNWIYVDRHDRDLVDPRESGQSPARLLRERVGSDAMDLVYPGDAYFTQKANSQLYEMRLIFQLLTCFSLRRNWCIFVRKNAQDLEPNSQFSNHTAINQHLQSNFGQMTKSTSSLPSNIQDPKSIRDSNLEFSRSKGLLSGTRKNLEDVFARKMSRDELIVKSNHQDVKSASTSMLNDQLKMLKFSQSGDKQERRRSSGCSQSSSFTSTIELKDHSTKSIEVEIEIEKDSGDPEARVNWSSRNQPARASTELELDSSSSKLCHVLSIRIQPDDQFWIPKQTVSLSHLSGLRLIVILWITMGMSFLYPSANNYQYYRSIINMNITRDSVWFAATNYTLGLDMLLYMSGLVFVYKLARVDYNSILNSNGNGKGSPSCNSIIQLNSVAVLSLLTKKILRFWPTYLTLIGLAIVAPLLSDGPMWPEMVGYRLGEVCRRNWWSNLLFVNNFLYESDICLPSSWFVSVLMQLFLIGSLVVLLIHKYSLKMALAAIGVLLAISCSFSYGFAYTMNLPAPVIRMDQSFVMSIDDHIFHLYTNIFNNLAPFLVGMLGGLLLIRSTNILETQQGSGRLPSSRSPRRGDTGNASSIFGLAFKWLAKTPLWPGVLMLTLLVLSSVLHEHYSRPWAAAYWSLHRLCWAISTGYLIHQCATYKWRLLHDILSLSSFIPISRLIFITYLVFPIFIHMHSGMVRDGLHVTLYNMMNIYTTRLVFAFGSALTIHLLVELPFCSVEEILIHRWLSLRASTNRIRATPNSANPPEQPEVGAPRSGSHFDPLLAVAPVVAM